MLSTFSITAKEELALSWNLLFLPQVSGVGIPYLSRRWCGGPRAPRRRNLSNPLTREPAKFKTRVQ